MKKAFLAIFSIAAIVAMMCAYGCKKDQDVKPTEQTESISLPKTVPGTNQYYAGFYYKDHRLGNCYNPKGRYLCGFDVTEMDGEAACMMMQLLDDPFAFIFPCYALNSCGAGDMIDSAKNGAITFDADCTISDEKLAESLKTDILPAGRYAAYIDSYCEDTVVVINFADPIF